MRHILNLNADVFSFDIFDTVLVKKTATPIGTFFIMQHRLRECNLIPHELLLNFIQLRIKAEEKARQRTKNEEITISQIYNELGRSFSLSMDVQKLLINMEIEEEFNAVSGVPQILNIIDSIRCRKSRIVFVSDMYLPKNQIRKMLEKVGACKERDNLYISSDSLVTKSTGKLFRYMLKKEQCKPNRCVHIGDNLRSDVICARHVGIHAVHFKKAKLSRYENAILGETQSLQSYEWQLLAGASRVARLASNEKDNSQFTLHCLGASIVGPIFLGFVLWLLRKAKACKMQRLYFISRDGQIFLELAKRIDKRLDLKLDLRYLYGSRQAWHLPSVTELGEREFEWLLEADPTVSIRVFSNRAGLEPESVQNEISKIFGKNWKLDDNLSNNEIKQLRGMLLHSELKSRILNRAQNATAVTLGYFRQEGLMDDIPWGIVDLGWHGNMQDSLKKILEIGGITNEIYGFYFGLLASSSNGCQSNKKLSFFCSPKHKPFSTICSKMVNLLEIFASATHGTTLSYYHDGDIYYPRLKHPLNEGLLDWEFMHLREGIFQFLENIPTDILETFWDRINIDTYRERIALCMKLLRFNPTPEEAEAIGNCPFSSDQAETYLSLFAPPLSTLDLIRYYLNWDKRKKYKLTLWIEGTRARSRLMHTQN